MTNTDICNIALSYIGKRQIQSLDEQSETARQCKLHYNNARQNLLRSYAWGFAKKVTVAALLNTKYPGWEYVYAYPSECVSLRLIFNEEGARIKDFEKTEHEVFLVDASQKGVACNLPGAYFEYTADIVDAGAFSIDFCKALQYTLAADMALALTSNPKLQQMYFQYAQISLYEAKISSANEQHDETNWPHKYSKARL